MKIAVTGASGFVGRAVMAALQRRGIAAVGCARAAADAPAASGHRFMAMDLHDAPLDAFEQLGRPDTLIHLAWSGLPNYRSLHHIDPELPAQYRFLRGLVNSGLVSLLVAGTCFEYGMQSGPLDEDLPARPDNPYGFAKDALRRELEFLRTMQPFALTWARLFYLHGEGQAETSLLPQLRRAVAAGEPAFDLSGGEQLRDYLPVAEAADLLVALALARRDAGVVNVCSGRPISVRRFVEDRVREHGWTIELRFGRKPYPDYEPMAFWGDRRKLDGILGGR
jgi:dTDP-6-deoxy-L-talose 4-dehydrogenase (NAD+)